MTDPAEAPAPDLVKRAKPAAAWPENINSPTELILEDCADAITRLTAEVERLKIENVQMKFALGYPMPADLERYIIPSNPFRCGTCDARNINRLSVEVERLTAALERLSNELRQFGYEESTLAALTQEPRT